MKGADFQRKRITIPPWLPLMREALVQCMLTPISYNGNSLDFYTFNFHFEHEKMFHSHSTKSLF